MNRLEAELKPSSLEGKRDAFLNCVFDGFVGDAVDSVPYSALRDDPEAQLHFIGMLAQGIHKRNLSHPSQWPVSTLTDVEFFITYAIKGQLKMAITFGMQAYEESPRTFFRDVSRDLAHVVRVEGIARRKIVESGTKELAPLLTQSEKWSKWFKAVIAAVLVGGISALYRVGEYPARLDETAGGKMQDQGSNIQAQRIESSNNIEEETEGEKATNETDSLVGEPPPPNNGQKIH